MKYIKYFPIVFAIALGGCDDKSGADSDTGGQGFDSQSEVTEQPQGCQPVKGLEPVDFLCSSGNEGFIRYPQESFGSFSETDRFGSLPKRASDLRGFDRRDQTVLGFNKSHSITSGEEAFVEPGTDVTLHIVKRHERNSFSTSKIVISVLLNYQPVEAEIVNYDAERSEKEHSVVGTTATFPIDANVEQYDLTIPSEEFEGRGRYTLSFVTSGIGDPNTSELQEEYIVNYGGCKPQPFPCMKKVSASAPNSTEEAIRQEAIASTTLYPVGTLSGADPLSVISVEPGQMVEMEYSTRMDRFDWNAVFIPLLDGERAGDPNFLYFPEEPDQNSNGSSFVGGRSSFSIGMPSQPGTYRVEIAAFRNPILSRQEALDLGLGGSTFATGSNSLRFRVESP